MKKIKRKSGFTLVECVVAMAVLAILSLLLTMLLNITLNTRNTNINMEQDIDEQVANIAKNNGTNKEGRNDTIEFKQNGTVIDTIPKNNDQGIIANKIPYAGDEVTLDIIEYDFSKYKKFETVDEEKFHCGNCNKDFKKEDLDENGKCPICHSEFNKKGEVWGSASVSDGASGNVTITSGDIIEDATMGTVTIPIEVTFNASASANEFSLKVQVPPAAKRIIIGSPSSQTSAKVLGIAGDTVRIEPTAAGSVVAKFSVVYNSADIDTDYIFGSPNQKYNFHKFYTGAGEGSSATFYKDTSTGKFNSNS